MIRLLILSLLISTPAWAGINVCHDGFGTVTHTTLRGGHLTGCEYFHGDDRAEYDRVRGLIKTVSRQFLKWDDLNFLREMTQAEKDVVTAATRAAREDAVRQQAKIQATGFSIEEMRLRAALICLGKWLNEVRTDPLTTKPAITKSDAVQCIAGEIDSGRAD